MSYIYVFAIALVSCYLLTPAAKRLAIALNVLDYPNERKIHMHPVPYLGGLALFTSVMIALLSLGMFAREIILFPSELYGIITGAALIVLVGLFDDIHKVKAWIKFIVQIIVGILMFSIGLRIDLIISPFGGVITLGKFSIVFTVLWYCLIINAINFIDGLDGLAAGITAIAAATIFAISMDTAGPLSLFLGAILFGVAVGFLPHNFHPAKIFMGDAGSMLLGFLLATLTLTTSTKAPAMLALIVPLLAMAIPLFDAVFAFLRRTLKGKNPFLGDRRHLHHRLLSMGLSHRRVVFALYYISIYFGLTAFILSRASPEITLLVVFMIGVGLLLLVESLNYLEKTIQNRASSTTKRKE